MRKIRRNNTSLDGQGLVWTGSAGPCVDISSVKADGVDIWRACQQGKYWPCASPAVSATPAPAGRRGLTPSIPCFFPVSLWFDRTRGFVQSSSHPSPVYFVAGEHRTGRLSLSRSLVLSLARSLFLYNTPCVYSVPVSCTLCVRNHASFLFGLSAVACSLSFSFCFFPFIGGSLSLLLSRSSLL